MKQAYDENKLILGDNKIINKHTSERIFLSNGEKHISLDYDYNLVPNIVKYVARKELIIYFSCIIHNPKFWAEKSGKIVLYTSNYGS